MIHLSRPALLNLLLRGPGFTLCAAALVAAYGFDAMLPAFFLFCAAVAWALLWIGAHELFHPAINAWVDREPD